MRERVAIVTGGASGIGEAIAYRLAHEGMRLIIADVDSERGLQVARGIKATDGEAIFVQHDVTVPAQWAALISATRDSFGGVDVLINNAGVMLAASIDTMSLAQWRRVMDINLMGVFLGMKSTYEPLRERGGGAMVNISSTAGMRGTAFASAYAASKAGVTNLTRTAAREWATAGAAIRVNAVHPGPIETPIYQRIDGEGVRQLGGQAQFIEHVKRGIPLGRFGSPADVADAVSYLVSGRAAFVTGASLCVDGGQSC
jgi:NAD(P)-dependent dehydrogenase (short-subunit alcohol dehydrogenase family)